MLLTQAVDYIQQLQVPPFLPLVKTPNLIHRPSRLRSTQDTPNCLSPFSECAWVFCMSKSYSNASDVPISVYLLVSISCITSPLTLIGRPLGRTNRCPWWCPDLRRASKPQGCVILRATTCSEPTPNTQQKQTHVHLSWALATLLRHCLALIRRTTPPPPPHTRIQQHNSESRNACRACSRP